MTNDDKVSKIIEQILRMPGESPASIQSSVKHVHQRIRKERRDKLIEQLVELNFLSDGYYTDIIDETSICLTSVIDNFTEDEKDKARTEWKDEHKTLRGFEMYWNTKVKANKKPKEKQNKESVLEKFINIEQKQEDVNQALKEAKLANIRRALENNTSPNDSFSGFRNGPRDDGRVDPRSGKSGTALDAAKQLKKEDNRRSGGITVNLEALQMIDNILNEGE